MPPGSSNFNLDLMYALPGQDVAAALRDVEEALALEPAHISHYQLTMEPGTVFAAQPPPLPDDDSRGEMLSRLPKSAWRGADLRNTRSPPMRGPGRQCRHNLNYWSFGDYLGVGAGAHGKLTACGTRAASSAPLQTREPRRYLAAPDGAAHAPAIAAARAALRIHAERAAAGRAGSTRAQFESARA